MNDERCGKLEKDRNNLKKKEKEKENENIKYKNPIIKRIHEDDFGYGEYPNENDFSFENENDNKEKCHFSIREKKADDNDIIDDLDVEAIKNNLQKSKQKYNQNNSKNSTNARKTFKRTKRRRIPEKN